MDLKKVSAASLVSNVYLNTTVQKAFVDCVPGCTEHLMKLLSIIEEARQKQVPGSVLAGLGKCFWERAPPAHLFLPEALPCPSQHNSSCLHLVPGTCWSCPH